MSSLIYVRIVRPYSNSKTFAEVIPKLFERCSFSLDQLYSGLEYLGDEYKKVIEIYNHQVAQNTNLILHAPILTVRIFILKLIKKMISG